MLKYAEENNGVGVVVPAGQNTDGVEILDNKVEEGSVWHDTFLFIFSLSHCSNCLSVGRFIPIVSLCILHMYDISLRLREAGPRFMLS